MGIASSLPWAASSVEISSSGSESTPPSMLTFEFLQSYSHTGVGDHFEQPKFMSSILAPEHSHVSSSAASQMLIGSSLSKGSNCIADTSSDTSTPTSIQPLVPYAKALTLKDIDSQPADRVPRSIDSGVKRPGLKRSRDSTTSSLSTPTKRLREAESTHILSAQTLINSVLYLLISFLLRS